VRHNCLVHLAIDADDPSDVQKLLAKICAASAKQDGVVFAYSTQAPSLTRAAERAPLKQPEPEELFRS
jgi:hypothetical protein